MLSSSTAAWEELQLDALTVAAELRDSATTLRPGDGRQPPILSDAADLAALADYAAARASGRIPDAHGYAVMAEVQDFFLEIRRL